MEPNNLVVTVVGARGLTLKGTTQLAPSVTLCLQGKSSLRSKCVTERVEATGADAEWKESCEFKIMEGASKLTATCNHHTRLGGTDLIGKIDIPLEDIRGAISAMWFPLSKKAKDEKYRGELLLTFKFSYVKPTLSISNMSLNNIPKDSALAKIKRKMKLGRGGKDKDGLSVASMFPGTMRRERPDSPEDEMIRNFAANSMGRGSTLPAGGGQRQSIDPAMFTKPQQRVSSTNPFETSGGGSSLNVSAMSTAESFSHIPSSLVRHNSRRSFASSGFGSRNSRQLPAEEGSPDSAKAGLAPLGEHSRGKMTAEEWDLATQVDRLKAEMAVKDSRIRDMEVYIDSLVQRVMESHPELLSSTKNQPASKAFFAGSARHRFF